MSRIPQRPRVARIRERRSIETTDRGYRRKPTISDESDEEVPTVSQKEQQPTTTTTTITPITTTTTTTTTTAAAVAATITITITIGITITITGFFLFLARRRRVGELYSKGCLNSNHHHEYVIIPRNETHRYVMRIRSARRVFKRTHVKAASLKSFAAQYRRRSAIVRRKMGECRVNNSRSVGGNPMKFERGKSWPTRESGKCHTGWQRLRVISFVQKCSRVKFNKFFKSIGKIDTPPRKIQKCWTQTMQRKGGNCNPVGRCSKTNLPHLVSANANFSIFFFNFML
ncbi:unnamed protein product, partial [Nesidiocoris tenuis]